MTKSSAGAVGNATASPQGDSAVFELKAYVSSPGFQSIGPSSQIDDSRLRPSHASRAIDGG